MPIGYRCRTFRIAVGQALRPTIDFIKLSTFCTANKAISWANIKPTELESLPAIHLTEVNNQNIYKTKNTPKSEKKLDLGSELIILKRRGNA